MKRNESRSLALEIMIEFTNRTGLSTARKVSRRYLWTDAFAVCNFLELYHQTRDEKYKNLALHLVNQVHNVLGRHRKDDPRTGWISGLDEDEGKIHPTKGGLRIGKEMNERRPTDSFDERVEWDRDGQYYHYLTKWMHALNCVSRFTGDATYNILAIELAKTAHAKFTYIPPSGGQKRMYWKMSIDLSYPLVESMGHHDPLDGFITYYQLQTTAMNDTHNPPWSDLSAEISDMVTICEEKNWTTDDPLGLGSLLCDAFRVAQLIINDNFEQTDLLEILLYSSLQGLESYMRSNPLNLPAEYRLAFRELGLSIGLGTIDKLQALIEQNHDLFTKQQNLRTLIKSLMQYQPLMKAIESYWHEPMSRKAKTWTEHHDINMVMLATSMIPDAYLTIQGRGMRRSG
jgi:hypothetical protein